MSRPRLSRPLLSSRCARVVLAVAAVAAAALASDAAARTEQGRPTISRLAVTAVTRSSARVTWTTDIPATSAVVYGTASSHGLAVGDARRRTRHSVLLRDLLWSKTYHVVPVSRVAGVTARAPRRTFTTLPLASTPRRSAIGGAGADKYLTVDGSPFFPIMQFLVCGFRIRGIAEAGVNVFFIRGCRSDTAASFATEAARNNVLATDWYDASVKTHPGIYGWVLEPDEPDCQPCRGPNTQVLPREIAAQRDRNVAADPGKINFLTIMSGFYREHWRQPWMGQSYHWYTDYAAATDVLFFDSYPYIAWCRPTWASQQGTMQRILIANHASKARNFPPTMQWIEDADEQRPGENCSPPAPVVRSEVWQAVTNGARGIGWFSSVFNPSFDQYKLAPAVAVEKRRTNRQLANFNGPLAVGTRVRATATTTSTAFSYGTRINVLARRYRGTTYVFAVNDTASPLKATFRVNGLPTRRLHVFEERRAVAAAADGTFTDAFGPYGVHIYVAAPAAASGSPGGALLAG